MVSSTYNILLHILLVTIKKMPISGLNIAYVACFLSYGDFSSKFILKWVTYFFKSTYYTEIKEKSEKNTNLSFALIKSIYIHRKQLIILMVYGTSFWKKFTFVDTIFWSMIISPNNDNVCLLLETAKYWTCKLVKFWVT